MKTIKNTKLAKRIRIKKRIRTTLKGTSLRPRLSVFRSNKAIYAQLIDDNTQTTLASASDLTLKEGTKKEKAIQVGAMIAAKAKEKNISSVVFDRNGYNYTGRIQLLADSAREGGLTF